MHNEIDKIEFLLKFIRGGLSDDAAKDVEQALKSDPELMMLFQLLTEIENETKVSDWSHILKFANQSAGRMFDDFQKSRNRGDDIYAIRTYDSKLTPLPEGVRPAAVDCRRIKYKVSEYDLELSIYPISTDSREIIGKIHKAAFKEPPEVSLKAGRMSFEVVADRFNLFRFERVPVAEYTMTLISSGDAIGIVELSL